MPRKDPRPYIKEKVVQNGPEEQFSVTVLCMKSLATLKSRYH